MSTDTVHVEIPTKASMNEGTNDESTQAAAKNSIYWLDPGFSVFQVENVLFRVPNYQFIREQSSVLASMFALPQNLQAVNVEGTSVENPIILPSVKSEDFGNLLKVLYPLDGQVKLSSAEWISVLKLSTLWYLLAYRKRAIAHLSTPGSITPVQKISLGRNFQVLQWLLDGYREMIEREPIITDAEATEIGMLQSISLGRLREPKWQTPVKRRYMISWSSLIEENFAVEISTIKSEQEGYGEQLDFKDLSHTDEEKNWGW